MHMHTSFIGLSVIELPISDTVKLLNVGWYPIADPIIGATLFNISTWVGLPQGV